MTAQLTGGAASRRRPITDVDARLDGLDCDVRQALRPLGELLVGVAERETYMINAWRMARRHDQFINKIHNYILSLYRRQTPAHKAD
ncbi:hypothetical protein F0Q45_18975 [Mycobacterium simiae]|uniref:Uncharacterized protein n=1 Tax=Mycobacterium simiae TaxID=1784 RepID=A0A5B1BK15_MYCSI|nr:hypothetical protein [Mycobacterium simiae]KAA1248726.1 hypothetical protein F0Q45_18975 [Mycobacterium simiae]